MEREKLESMLIDYLDGTLEEANARKEVEQELAENPEARIVFGQLKEMMEKMDHVAELTPGEALKKSFDHFLSQEIVRVNKPKSITLIPMVYRVAAGIVLLMTVGIAAYWVRKDFQNQERLAKIEQELEVSKQMIMTLLDNDFSPSQRMQGVSVAYHMSKPDDEIIGALVHTFNNDPNTNVRLAALDALSKFSEEEEVRQALIEALATQKDPVILISLIQLLVKMREKTVVHQLEKMTQDEQVMKAVRDEAYSGIFKLS